MPADPATPPHTWHLRIEPQGWTLPCPPGTSLREAAAAAGITLPSSCRNGTCRACLTHLRAGTVHYRVDWPGLSPEERTEGWTLPCVAVPDSDVVLEAPLAHRLGDELQAIDPQQRA